jgi:hypothetical protein
MRRVPHFVTSKSRHMYTHIWHKYLPVIKILLKKSVRNEQRLALNKTDFEKGRRSGKPSCSFSVSLDKGRLTTIAPPVYARELVDLLLEDELTRNVLKQGHFRISLNNDLQLRLVYLDPAESSNNVQPVGEQA